MRTFTLILLSALALAAFAACGGDDDDDTGPSENASFDSVTIPLEDPTVTPSGLKYVDVVVGDGASPTIGKNVSVQYTGTFLDGTEFDSSFDAGRPIEFPIGLGRVIAGWDEGLSTMKVGGKRILEIPAGLAYGPSGRGPIPPDTTLIFEVELVAVEE
jgi:FKBP-type peptidyl-prolyl cis-trans isomerase FkpA